MTTEQPPPEPESPPEPDPQTPEGGEPDVKDPEALLRSNEKYRHENIALHKRLTAAESELEETRKANLSEQEKAIEEAEARGRAEAEATIGAQLRRERITNRAYGKLADPEDASRYLDLDKLDPDDGEAIDKAIADLIKAKPYLAAHNGTRSGIDQGPQGSIPDPGANPDEWLRRSAQAR